MLARIFPKVGSFLVEKYFEFYNVFCPFWIAAVVGGMHLHQPPKDFGPQRSIFFVSEIEREACWAASEWDVTN